MTGKQSRLVLLTALILASLPNLRAWSAQSAPSDSDSPMHTHESEPGDSKLNVAVLLYDGALLLDYGIAAEMFLASDYMRKFHVYTVGRQSNVSLSIVGSTTTDYTFDDAPKPDVIIVPGGPTWSQEGANPMTQDFLRSAQSDSCILFSICTGAMLLGKAGLLDGHTVTTNYQAAKALQDLVPSAKVVSDRLYVDDGLIVTSAGAGTAIEATLHLIERLSSRDIARDMGQRYLNYPHMEE